MKRLTCFLLALLCFVVQTINAQSVLSNEAFPNTFNTGFTRPINSTFTGSIGTWNAYSNDNKSTTVVNTAFYQSGPCALKLVNYSTSGSSTSSSCYATAPKVNLGSLGCVNYVNLSFKLYTYKVVATNTSYTFFVEVSGDNGTTWNSIYSKTAKQLNEAFGQGAWNSITAAIPSAYHNSNFKYRFRGTQLGSCASDNYIYIDDVKILAQSCATTTCPPSYFQPNSAAKGFNVFVQQGVTLNNGHVDGAVASGGNAILDGAVTVAMNNPGDYPYGSNNVNNYGMVVGGKMVYTTGGQSKVNNGYLRLADATGSKLWDKDPNNANVNLRVTSSAQSGWNGYNSNPALQVQKIQSATSANAPAGIDFTAAFTTINANSNAIAGYTSASSCAPQMVFKTLTSGSNTLTLTDNKINVINLTCAQFLTISKITFTNQPNATRPVIFNINQTGNIAWTPFQTAGLSNANGQYILYNFYNCTGSIYIDGANAVYGTILAPKASVTWNNTNNLEGQLIAKYALICNGEIHDQPWNVCLPECSSYVPNSWTFSCINGSDDVVDFYAVGTKNAGTSLITLDIPNPANVYKIVAFLSGSTAANPNQTVVLSSRNTSNTVINSTTLASPTKNLSGNIRMWERTFTSTGNVGKIGVQVTNLGDAGYTGNGLTIMVYRSGVPNQFSTGEGIHWGQISNTANGAGDYSDDFTIPTASAPRTVTVKVVLNEIDNDGKFAKLTATAGTVTQTVNVANNASFGDRVNIVTLTLNNVPGNVTIVNVNASQAQSTETFSVDAVSVTVANACASLTLGNVVWNDINANGTKDANEPGVAGASVKLYRDDNNDDVPDNGTSPIATTSTGPTGLYSFTNLTAGNYVVGVLIPAGYTKGPVSTTDPDNNIDNDNNGVNLIGANQAGSEVRTKAITLSATGEPATDGDDNNGNLTLDVALCGAGQIGDFVWDDLNNNGLQDAGEPGMPNISVTLKYTDGISSITKLTDGNGKYFFTALGPGTYTVSFVTPAGYTSSPANVGSNDAIDSDPVNGNALVVLAANENNTKVDAGFYKPGILKLGNLVWNDSDGDGKKDADEYGLASVQVKLYEDDNNDNIADGAVMAQTTTDAFGYYSFSALNAGSYIISIPVLNGFSAGGNTATSNDPDNNTDNDNNGLRVVSGELFTNAITLSAGSEPTTDGDGNNSNLTLDIALCGNGSVGDFVWHDANCNGIQDAGEAGINGVKVTITYADGTQKSVTTQTFNGANGYYSFGGLGIGNFTITFETPSGYTATAARAGSDITKDSDPVNGSVTLTMAANQNNPCIDAGYCATIVLNLGNLVWNDINANGKKETDEPGVGGVTVRLYRDADGNNIPDGAFIATTTTAVNGGYNFAGLAAGKYIVGVVVPAGFTAGPVISTSANADNDIDNDNNAVRTSSGEWRTNYITLTNGGEPVNDGDGNNGNLTLDIAICGSNTIGDFVWNDLNRNGVQDTNEPGIANAVVTITFADNTERSTTTNAQGKYAFTALGTGTFIIEFVTPAGATRSPSNQGGDDAKDSDPNTATGEIAVNITGANTVNNSIDAGFYKATCYAVQSACGAGYLTRQTTVIKNGDFSIALTNTPGNTFSGNFTTPGVSYNFAGGSFIAQSEYKGINVKPSNDRSFSIINTTTAFTASGGVNQKPFPGDAANSVPATNYFMYKMGNNLGGDGLIWQQTASNLVIGKNYRFRFYVSNMMEPSNDVDNPLIKVFVNGTSGLANGTVVLGPVNIDEASTANNTALNGWKRLEYSFTATSVSMTFKIAEDQSCTNEINMGLTAIGIEVCEPDTDSDCVADIDDIDDDNDGITDLVESGGYDPLKDCDNDGTPNYLDQTPGCPTPTGTDVYGKPYKPLVWVDCVPDGINDMFDWDYDGIINELDLDSDNDGILDVQEARDTKAVDNNNDGMVDGVDVDGDGLLSTADANDNVIGGPGLTPQDLDRDNNPNYLDLDSDGDGITDIKEALNINDNDGLTDGTDGDEDGVRSTAYTNADNIADNYNGFGAKGILLLDRDNDGKPNPYDIDSDNDGISDNVEGQPTCSEVQPTATDTDGDGLDNAYDVQNNPCTRHASGITPYDKDGDATPDMYDLDTDNDGAADANEGSGIYGEFVTNFGDTDGDGMIDQFDIFNINTATLLLTNNVGHNQMGPNGNFDGPVPSGSNAQLPKSKPGDCPTVDRDWRDVSILPVSLISFTGNLNNNNVKLTWTVANEVSMAHYVVERSTDGRTFAPVAKVMATPNTGINKVYTADDNIAGLSGAVYYRLHQVENAGGYKYSNVLAFRLNGKATISMSMYPNPAREQVVLKVFAATEGSISIKISDMLGKQLLTQTNRVSAGINALNITGLQSIAPGTYTVQVLINGQAINQRLIIAR